MQPETQQHMKLGKYSSNMHKQTISDLLSAAADAAEEQTDDQTQVSENKHIGLKYPGLFENSIQLEKLSFTHSILP